MSKSPYTFTAKGDTLIEDYNRVKPFSSFFPGLAGPYGVPLWVFYVNRGQCIASFGTESKENAILEFFPANRSYQLTPHLGFRTFLKVTRNNKCHLYEPFQSNSAHPTRSTKNRMIFNSACLTLEEENTALDLRVRIKMMTVPGEPFAGLARRVELENIGEAPLSIECIDGLPWINAYGINSWIQKHMSRTAEAWVHVENMKNGAPFFKLKVDTADKPETEYITRGNFAVFSDDTDLLPAIIDPTCVFGNNTSLLSPDAFYQTKSFSIPPNQTDENFTPCAMTQVTATLEPQGTHQFHALFGHAHDIDACNEIAASCKGSVWFDEKYAENVKLITCVMQPMDTFSGSVTYDNYCRQTFLDNVLRGGLPVKLPGQEGQTQLVHLYSRKHGDLERDYNHFSLQASYFSQGNGNFRDVNQNRRNDCWFNTDVGPTNVRTFFNLLQLDGHNPLVIRSAAFRVSPSPALQETLKECVGAESVDTIAERLNTPFTPGPLLTWIHENRLSLKVSKETFLQKLTLLAERLDEAVHGEGFWSDHWTYNLDLIENYLSVFPENCEKLLFQDHQFTYYQNAAWINPRKIRYILRNNKPFQTNNVFEDEELLKHQSAANTQVRTVFGQGDVYTTNLFSKLICLITNKIATLDPFGVGIEMEGGKPNWYDSLNGLPGLFGSSTNETIELKRLILFCLEQSKQTNENNLSLPKELDQFLKSVSEQLSENLKGQIDAFTYWDKSATAKEKYRECVRHGIQGEERAVPLLLIKKFLENCHQKCNQAIDQAYAVSEGVIPSYFINELVSFDTAEEKGQTTLIPKAFRQKPCALFLEGPVHNLKIAGKKARKQYQAIKASDLYDKKLKMYKVNASLKEMPVELGRCAVFSPGWLENESIWLHMEYKFLLEILRSGLHKDFINEFKNILIPFQNPDRYGRSILENSSFIVSSANPNESLHGNGFVARLSGSTAEFIHIWLAMNLGPNPVFLDTDKVLTFEPRPVLPSWLFQPEPREIQWTTLGKTHTAQLPPNHFGFILFNTTLIVYENPNLKATYGRNPAVPRTMKVIDSQGKIHHTDTGKLSGSLVHDLRDGKIQQVHVLLGND